MFRVDISEEAWKRIREIINGIPDDIDEIHIVNQTRRINVKKHPSDDYEILSNSRGSAPKMTGY